MTKTNLLKIKISVPYPSTLCLCCCCFFFVIPLTCCMNMKWDERPKELVKPYFQETDTLVIVCFRWFHFVKSDRIYLSFECISQWKGTPAQLPICVYYTDIYIYIYININVCTNNDRWTFKLILGLYPSNYVLRIHRTPSPNGASTSVHELGTAS